MRMNFKLLWWNIFELFCAVLETSTDQHQSHNRCVSKEIRLTCDHELPEYIPDTITEVYITDFNQDTLGQQKQVFKNTSWKSVKKLDIIINTREKFDIFNYDYFDLKNLTFLGIHSPELTAIEEYGFAGLQQLVHLDLSDCQSLSSRKIVLPLMTNNSTPNLKTLNLSRLNSLFLGNFAFRHDFMEMIMTKQIEILILSGCNILITDFNVFNRDNSLKVLDFSNITITNVDHFTNATNKREYFFHFLTNLHTLNMSFIPPRVFNANLILKNDFFNSTTEDCLQWPNKLEVLDMSYSFDEVLIMNNLSMDITNCNANNLKSFYFKGNSMLKLNGTILWPQNSELERIDFSSNKITYFSPNILKGQSSLKQLCLSNNSLYEMEKLPEFQNILQTCQHLEHLDISFNKLTQIPYHMFDNSAKLRTLNLRGNKLTDITFQMSSLISLDILDLRQNKIKFVKDFGLNAINNLFQLARTNKSRAFTVHFRDNPLKCSCDSVNFVTWLERELQPYMQVENTCTLDGDITGIDKLAVQHAEYLCYRFRNILMASTTSFVFFISAIIIFAVVIKQVRKKEQKRVIKHFFDDLKHEKLEEQNLIFLSYCSDDGDLVLDKVYTPLDITLKEMTGLKSNIICHGDANFLPGLSIISEIMRCISQCCVIIFVVSRAFCKSDWCRMEVKEAYEQDKPIILIFKENVEKKSMPNYLRRIFERNTRVKLLEINGIYDLVPSFQCVCESVILMASNKQKEKIQDGLNLKQAQENEPATIGPGKPKGMCVKTNKKDYIAVNTDPI